MICETVRNFAHLSGSVCLSFTALSLNRVDVPVGSLRVVCLFTRARSNISLASIRLCLQATPYKGVDLGIDDKGSIGVRPLPNVPHMQPPPPPPQPQQQQQLPTTPAPFDALFGAHLTLGPFGQHVERAARLMDRFRANHRAPQKAGPLAS